MSARTVASVESGRGYALTVLLRIFGAAVALVAVTCCGNDPAAPQAGTATVIARTPHDTQAWTEGLVFDGPDLYEGTGLRGRSQLRQLDPATGVVLRAADLPPDLYGEGIAVVGDVIWQLTWKNGVAIAWDKASFTPKARYPMEGEGWGLCYDGNRLIRSDGTDRLRFHTPTTFAETGSVSVTYEGKPFKGLNELECVQGEVWANVWPTDQIVRIDPSTGKVTELVRAPLYTDPAGDKDAVLNGIASAGDGEFLLTGKLWPTMFRVRFDSTGA